MGGMSSMHFLSLQSPSQHFLYCIKGKEQSEKYSETIS